MNSKSGHAVWLTGLKRGEDGKWNVIINDSFGQPGRDGQGAEYPLEIFMAATQDFEHLSIITGESAPTRLDALETSIYKVANKVIDDTLFNMDASLSSIGLHYSDLEEPVLQVVANNPDFLEYLEEQNPGITEAVEEQQMLKAEEDARIKEQYGIDLEYLEELIGDE